MCECVFCKIIKKESPAHIVYENDFATVVLDIAPINEGHVLILPHEHVDSIDKLSEEMAMEIMTLSRKMVKTINSSFHAEGYTLMQNGGQCCDFGHCHVHIFPRYESDGFGFTSPEGTFECSENVAEKIRREFIKVML